MMEDPRKRYFKDEERVDLRFSPPKANKTFRIGALWDTHHEVLRRLSLGEKGTKIAEDLGISTAMVTYTKNSKLGQARLGILRGAMDAETIDLGIRINKFAPKALKLLEDIVEGRFENVSPALRAKYADRHLDRAGYSPVRKVAVASGQLSREDIEEIKNRAMSSAKRAGVVSTDQGSADNGKGKGNGKAHKNAPENAPIDIEALEKVN